MDFYEGRMEDTDLNYEGKEISCPDETGSFETLQNFLHLSHPPNKQNTGSCEGCEDFELAWPVLSQTKKEYQKTMTGPSTNMLPKCSDRLFGESSSSKDQFEQTLKPNSDSTSESNKSLDVCTHAYQIPIIHNFSVTQPTLHEQKSTTTGNYFSTNLPTDTDNTSLSQKIIPTFAEDSQSSIACRQPIELINTIDTNTAMRISSNDSDSLHEISPTCTNKINTNNQLQAKLVAPICNKIFANGDEFDAFAKLVACQLRLLPLDRSLECQNTILQIVINERIKILACQPIGQQGEFQEPIPNSGTTGEMSHNNFS